MNDQLYLQHHGVLGMKWGVRKERKRIAKQRVARVRADIESKQHLATRPISKSEYDALTNSKVNVAGANSTLYRVAGEGTKKTLKDITYATIDPADNNRYVAMLSPEGGFSKDKYQLTLTNAQTLLSPSKKERIDTFIQLLGEDIPSPRSRKTITGREWMGDDHVSKSLSNFEFGLRSYNNFAQTQTLNTPLHSAYFEKIKDKGYTALIDDADMGFVSKMPIIIFPKQSGASITSTKKIQKDEILDAQINLKNLKG